MKILLDMNLPPKLADLLMIKGIETAHWFNIGAPDAKDIEIMEYARNNNFIVMTCDLDFSAILSATRGLKPSVIQIRTQGFNAEQIVGIIYSVLQQNTKELEKGAILTMDTKKARVRLLPL